MEVVSQYALLIYVRHRVKAARIHLASVIK